MCEAGRFYRWMNRPGHRHDECNARVDVESSVGRDAAGSVNGGGRRGAALRKMPCERSVGLSAIGDGTFSQRGRSPARWILRARILKNQILHSIECFGRGAKI